VWWPWPKRCRATVWARETLEILSFFVRGSDSPERRNMAEVIQERPETSTDDVTAPS
jgi:hypothetical protein